VLAGRSASAAIDRVGRLRISASPAPTQSRNTLDIKSRLKGENTEYESTEMQNRREMPAINALRSRRDKTAFGAGSILHVEKSEDLPS
jgi:hypothetical protein